MITLNDEQHLGLESLPKDSRVWIYKSKRAFSEAEKEHVLDSGREFTKQWQAHGAPMNAAIFVVADHFVVVAADESTVGATGCSIDSSVAYIRKLEAELKLTLTDRMFVILELEGAFRACSIDELKRLHSEGTISDETIVFDDLVSTLGELQSGFRKKLKDSWAVRFIA